MTENVAPPPVKKPARRGYTVSYKNKTLLSTIDPVTHAERTAAAAIAEVAASIGVSAGGTSTGGVCTGADQTLYFCPSPLLGYGLDTLLASLGPASAVLCVETDPQLLKLSRASLDQAILNNPRFALSGISSGTELCRFVRKTWGARIFRRIKTVKLSGGWQLDGGTYEEMAELITRDIAVDWGNAMTLVKLGRLFIRNALRNLVLPDSPQPAPSFGSKPVLVLGAGPSLDPLLDSLQASGALDVSPRPFILVCADTCLSLLKERSIKPDLAVILESQFWNMGDFIGRRNSGIPAAIDLSAYPPSRAVLNGPVFFFFTPWTSLKIFDRMKVAGILPPALPPLGSVGLTSVELARRLSSGPVITSGIDFSYTPDKTHARSSPAHLAALRTHNRFTGLCNPHITYRSGTFTTRSKSDIPVRSDPALRNYRNLFEQQFAADPRIRGRIFDIAGTGLSLGVKTLSIEEALEILAQPGLPVQSETPCVIEDTDQKAAGTVLRNFIEKEKSLLTELRAILSGSAPAGEGRLETLLDEADYLWAHFPDCAGAEGRRPSVSNLAFLKRVRTEIDPFIRLWEKADE